MGNLGNAWIAEWKNPPKQYRTWVRWWWPGLDVDPQELKDELKELDERGFGGAEIQAFLFGVPGEIKKRKELIHRFAPNPYYFEMLNAVLEEAAARNITIDVTISSAWPAGGTQVKKEDSLRTLLMGNMVVKGPQIINKPIPPYQLNTYYKKRELMKGIMGPILEDFYEENFQPIRTIAVKPLKKARKQNFVFPKASPLDYSTARDVSELVDENNNLNWDVPPGTWQIFTIYAGPCGMTPMNDAKSSPDLPSLVVDFFNRERTDRMLDGHLGSAPDAVQKYFGTTLRAMFTDSQEVASEWFWTEDFFDEFQTRRGYDIRPYLPVCFVPNRDNQFTEVFFQGEKPCYEFKDGIGEKIRYDWLRTLSDLWAERYCGGVSKWGQAHGGIKHRIQTYGIPLDLLQAYGAADIPETEQLYAGGILDFLKLAGSAGILYNKPIVSSESMVWRNRDHITTPFKWKVAVDRLFVAGINQVIIHGFPYAHPDIGYPSYDPWSWVSTNLNRHNPFWKYFPGLNDYTGRAQYILQQGHAHANVGVFYPHFNYNYKMLKKEEIVGGHLPGYDIPLPGGPIMWYMQKARKEIDHLILAQQELGEELTSFGYNYVHLNEECILKGKLQGSKLIIGSADLDVIIFPQVEKISLAVAEQLQAFIQVGGKVIFQSIIPNGQPGLLEFEENDLKIHEILKNGQNNGMYSILKKQNVGKYLDTKLQVLRGIILASPQPNIHYIHKSTPIGDIYFIRYGGQDPCSIEIGIPNITTPPIELNLWTGQIHPVRDTHQMDGTIQIPMKFDPYGSHMLLFPAEPLDDIGSLEKPNSAPLETPLHQVPLKEWNLKVDHRTKAGPIEVISMPLPKLKDWRKIKELQHCSGPGTYTTTFEISSEEEIVERQMWLKLGLVHDVAEITLNDQNFSPLMIAPYHHNISSAIRVGTNTLCIKVVGTIRNRLVGYGQKRPLMPVGLLGPVSIMSYLE